jgi:hypothetical protein
VDTMDICTPIYGDRIDMLPPYVVDGHYDIPRFSLPHGKPGEHSTLAPDETGHRTVL